MFANHKQASGRPIVGDGSIFAGTFYSFSDPPLRVGGRGKRMISGNYQLLSAAVTQAGQRLEPDYRAVRHFRTRPVVIQSDQGSVLKLEKKELEKKATQESDNGRKKVLTMLSALCSSSSSASVRTEKRVEKRIDKKAESKKAEGQESIAQK